MKSASEPRKIGVAISGGGHRAALWGAGVLLFLVDKDLNRRVSTISSVSGGSILNGVVGRQADFRNDDHASFREAIRPMVKSITETGLFFYGSPTNSYLFTTLTLVTLTSSAWLLAIGSVLCEVVRRLPNSKVCEPSASVVYTLVPIGFVLMIVFALLVILSYRYTREWSWVTLVPSLAGVAVGFAMAFPTAIPEGFRLSSSLDPLSAIAALWTSALALTGISIAAFGLRSRVAERAMRDVYFDEDTLDVLGHRAKDDRVLHVICATEVQSGLHAYFSQDFIYSYEFGAGSGTNGIRLARVVQASAALPGAFAPRRIRTSALINRPKRPGPMILVDGGVYDNMAEQWFVGLSNRASQLGGLEPVDDLVIANASTGWSWKPLGWLGLNVALVREGKALARVQAIMYNTVGRRRRLHLVDLWELSGSRERGMTVEVNDDPLERVKAPRRKDEESEAEHALRTRLEEDAPALSARLEEIALSSGFAWEQVVAHSRDYPTVLRRVEQSEALRIMWHAYIVTALSARRRLGVDVKPNDLPEYSRFKAELLDEEVQTD